MDEKKALTTTDLAHHRTSLASARSHLANERTHLAYLRTSLSLMSFGITLNRFSLYLRQNKFTIMHVGFLYETQIFGLGMVLLGMFILSWALFRYRQINEEIDTNTYKSPKESVTLITCIIIFLGGISALWLIIRRG